MHEVAIAQGIVRIAEDAARAQGFDRIVTVWVELGELAGVDAHALRFCFDAVTQGTLAAGARLLIEPVPGRGRCLACGAEVALPERFAACPQCGGHPVQPAGGTEMRVLSIEADHAEALAQRQAPAAHGSVESNANPTLGGA